jgi:hypothetical protein
MAVILSSVIFALGIKDDNAPVARTRLPFSLSRRSANMRHIDLCFCIVFFCCVLQPALGGNITYAWQEDDGQSVGGELIVTSQALSQGLISWQNVVAFDFAASTQYTSFFFDWPGFSSPIPISSVNGSPLEGGTAIFTTSEVPPGDAEITLDANWNTPYGEYWAADAFQAEGGGTSMHGYGHWEISGAIDPPAAAPEPSSLVLIGMGMIGGLAIARKAGSKPHPLPSSSPRGKPETGVAARTDTAVLGPSR